MRRRSENLHISHKIPQKVKRLLKVEDEVSEGEPHKTRCLCKECTSGSNIQEQYCKKTSCEQHFIREYSLACNEEFLYYFCIVRLLYHQLLSI